MRATALRALVFGLCLGARRHCDRCADASRIRRSIRDARERIERNARDDSGNSRRSESYLRARHRHLSDPGIAVACGSRTPRGTRRLVRGRSRRPNVRRPPDRNPAFRRGRLCAAQRPRIDFVESYRGLTRCVDTISSRAFQHSSIAIGTRSRSSPTSSRLARMHCLSVDLSPHVPLATVEINDTWVSHIVLDSGMAGGGALWDAVRPQLRRALVANTDYETMPSADSRGFCLRRNRLGALCCRHA